MYAKITPTFIASSTHKATSIYILLIFSTSEGFYIIFASFYLYPEPYLTSLRHGPLTLAIPIYFRSLLLLKGGGHFVTTNIIFNNKLPVLKLSL